MVAAMVGRKQLRCIALLGPAAILAACWPAGRTAEQTLDAYMTAVQQEDLPVLFCLSAGAADAQELGSGEDRRRLGFEEWARSHYAEYVTGRDEGWVEFDEHGIVMIKAFALGKGTFYTFGPGHRRGGALEVTTRLRFGYEQVDLSRMSPGTTFYLCGVPPGRMHAIRVPAGPREVSVEVLDSLDVRWTLVRSEAHDSCAGGWTVVSASPVEGSEISTLFTRVF